MAFIEGASDGALNGTTTVTIVAAPASSVRRAIKSINIYNKNASAVSITIQYSNAGVKRTIWHGQLDAGATWIYGEVGEVLILDATNKLIEAFLGANPSTNPDFVASWADIS